VTQAADLESHPLALLGHELRTPLGAIVGYAEAMRLEAFGPLPSPYGAHAGAICAAAAHLLALTNDLIDIARAETGVWRNQPEAFDPAALANEVLEVLRGRASENGLDLRFEASPGAAAALADRRATRQILFNLLDNAIRFAARGGTITLKVRREGAELVTSVADPGGGTPASDQNLGIGLRLAIALAAAQGGGLTLAPQPGSGAVATLRLPAAQA
jgi:signal transduction histidine kinase